MTLIAEYRERLEDGEVLGRKDGFPGLETLTRVGEGKVLERWEGPGLIDRTVVADGETRRAEGELEGVKGCSRKIKLARAEPAVETAGSHWH